MTFSPDGQQLAVHMTGIRLWDVATRKDVGLVTSPDYDEMSCVRFLPDGRRLVGHRADKLYVLTLKHEPPVEHLLTALRPLPFLLKSPAGRTAWAADGASVFVAGGSMTEWDAASGMARRRFPTEIEGAMGVAVRRGDGRVAAWQRSDAAHPTARVVFLAPGG